MWQREWLEAALESFACSLFKDGYRYCGFYSSASNTLAQDTAGLFKFADNPMSKVAAQIKRGERQKQAPPLSSMIAPARMDHGSGGLLSLQHV